MDRSSVDRIGILGLAHVGDAVYELLVRTSLCEDGHTSVRELHRLSVSLVKAASQAEASKRILPLLDDEELAVFRRGRNAQVNTVPHSADIVDYHAATGLEALFGWLYLLGRSDRLRFLYETACRINGEAGEE